MTTWLDAPPCATHSWRWVPTWANLGFDECWRCGVTGPVREGAAMSENESPVGGSTVAAEGEVSTPAALPVDKPEAAAGANGSLPLDKDGRGSSARKGRPALPPVAVTPRAEHLAVKGLRGGAAAARDAQIRACLIRGDRAVVVAKQFGISLARVYQIKDAAKAQGASA